MLLSLLSTPIIVCEANLLVLMLFIARFLVCVVVYYYSDIKICGEGGGAGGRAADQRGAGAAAAARHLGLQRADSKICSTDWNRLRVCRSALVETWPICGPNFNHNLFLIIMYHTAKLWRDISIAYLVVFVGYVLYEQPLQPFDI